MYRVRFLDKTEYEALRPLCMEWFHDDDEEDFLSSYLADLHTAGMACVKERIGETGSTPHIVSMAHVLQIRAFYPEGEKILPYILYVATDPSERRKGHMDDVLSLVLDKLKDAGYDLAFLTPVDKEIYRHLGFLYDWEFHEDEADLLLADDGLTECSAKLLNAAVFRAPSRLIGISRKEVL